MKYGCRYYTPQIHKHTRLRARARARERARIGIGSALSSSFSRYVDSLPFYTQKAARKGEHAIYVLPGVRRFCFLFPPFVCALLSMFRGYNLKAHWELLCVFCSTERPRGRWERGERREYEMALLPRADVIWKTWWCDCSLISTIPSSTRPLFSTCASAKPL